MTSSKLPVFHLINLTYIYSYIYHIHYNIYILYFRIIIRIRLTNCRGPKNLKDSLARVKVNMRNNNDKGMRKCGKSRCQICNYVIEGSRFCNGGILIASIIPLISIRQG